MPRCRPSVGLHRHRADAAFAEVLLDLGDDVGVPGAVDARHAHAHAL